MRTSPALAFHQKWGTGFSVGRNVLSKSLITLVIASSARVNANSDLSNFLIHGYTISVNNVRDDKPLYVAKAELFKSLGHPARIRILELLVEGEMSVSSLLVATGLEPSSLSQHLNVVKHTGLVQSTRAGNVVTYRVTDPSVGHFLAAARAVLASTLGRARQTLEDLVGPQAK